MACRHAPTVGPLAENRTGTEQVVVVEGYSSQAVYSPDGTHLLFVSSGRPGHKQAQIYEKDLSTGVERRITYQNGTTSLPRYHPKERLIIYGSTTDELKELPPILEIEKAPSKLPPPYQQPKELYIHDLTGLNIARVTKHSGYDGEAQFSVDGKKITWTQITNQRSQINGQDLARDGRPTRSEQKIQNLGKNPTLFVSATNGNLNAWVDWDSSFGVSRLLVQKKGGKPQEINTEMIVRKTDLAFTADSKWLLWAQQSKSLKGFELWALDTESLCSHRLSEESVDERRYPSVSPDMKWLTYTYVHKDKSSIARAAFQPASATCPSPP